MLNPITRWHHVAVAVAVALMPVLVALGLAADGNRDERFESKQILVTPAGAGVRIREVVDVDFGNEDRHGYQRVVPNDFGVPTDVVATATDASNQLTIDDLGTDTRIRIGDPNETVDGQHRYVLEYTLPAAHIDSGQLALDIINPDETLVTERFEVVVAGFDLQDATCVSGPAGSTRPCPVEAADGVYRMVFEPLPQTDGITIGGTIVGTHDAPDVEPPPLPPRHQVPWGVAALCLVLGVAGGVGTFALMRRSGRNLVAGTTAAEAALAPNAPGARLITDRELEAMATTEFEAPRGLRPWHGALLLREKVDDATVSAWFSDQIAQGVVELRDDGDELVAGPALATAPPVTKERIERLLGGESTLRLGTFQPRMQTLWKEIRAEQTAHAKESGWWDSHPPGAASSLVPVIAVLAFFVVSVTGLSWVASLRHSVVVSLVASLVVPAAVAWVAYRPLLPRRSATGSAAALQAESFRRFLEASEGRHVEWAWQHGLLREYSAWAVALGAAAAWGRAVAASAVPPAEVGASTMPMLMYSHAAAWHATSTPPSSSGGSGGGGGFSGGSVGGGGGGGSSGSW